MKTLNQHSHSRLKVARQILFFLWCIALISGCATPRPDPQVAKAYHLSNEIVTVSVDEAFGGKDRVLLKYRGMLKESHKEAFFYGSSLWQEASDDLTEEHPFHLVLPLTFETSESWAQEIEGLDPATTYGPEHWGAFRNRLIRQITPKEPLEGVVLTIDPDEFLYYRDGQGLLVLTKLEERPEKVQVFKTYSPAEQVTLALKTLEEYLPSIGRPSRRVVFETGDYRKGGTPFFYADLDRGIVHIMRLWEQPPHQVKATGGQKTRSAEFVVVESNVLPFIRNPVSTLHRIFIHFGVDDVADLMDPSTILPEKESSVPPLATGPSMDLEAWEKQLDEITHAKTSQGTIEFLINGDRFFPRLIDAYLSAEKSIDIRTFIFDNDDYATEIADLLKRRSEEVKVRLLLDGLATMGEAMTYPEDMPPDFEPPESMIEYLKKDSRAKVRIQYDPLTMADHVKTHIIDERLAFTGGMNIGREYRFDWHDMMMEVRGPVVGDLLREFEKRWHITGSDLGYFFYKLTPKKKYKAEPNGYYPIRVLKTIPGNAEIYNTQLAAIRGAKKYIYIENPYFSDNRILREVINARRRGVDVRVILTFSGNHQLMNKSNVVTANILLGNGIRVFAYPGMSHIKAAVYDGWACTGSANFDKLSLQTNLELNLSTSHPGAVQTLLDELFLPDFKKSMELTEPLPTNWKDYLYEKLGDHF
jgi:cardiolipin synthase